MLLLACTTPVAILSRELATPLPEAAPEPLLDTGFPIVAEATPAPDTAPPLPAPPRVVFNEVAPSNSSLIPGEFADFPDYLEIYNADSAPVAIRDLAVRDGSGMLWLGGDGFLEPGAFLRLYADDRDQDGHAPFTLDANGEELTLLVNGQVSDRFFSGPVDPDVVWARFPDGGSWDVTIYPTPGATNGATPSPTLEPSDRLFQMDHKVQVEITLSSDAYHSLEVDRLTYVQGDVVVDGVAYGEVGVRLKAYVGSARAISQKAGFKVDLNRYRDQKYAGVETLTLNNMVQDPTYIHEHLSYQVFEAMGVPVPRRAYANLYVNGTYFGLYLLLETVDETMLAHWFSDSSGALYEGAYGVDLYPGYEWSFDYDEGPDSTDRSDLTAVINVLARTPDDAMIADLEKLVNLDQILATRAAEALLYHWDGYTTANNYRLYHDPVGDRFWMIPWGCDQTFLGGYGPWSGGGYMWTRCMQNTACVDRYHEKLREAADVMESLDLVREAEALVAYLWDDINTDPRREFSMSTWQSYYDATISTIQTYPNTVRQQIPQ